MLIPNIFDQFPEARPAVGVLHIGAHHGEERALYTALGMTADQILWIDANQDYQSKFGADEHFLAALISDQDQANETFHITDNGESSSMLPLKLHLQEHPHVHEVGQRSLQTITVDSLLIQNGYQFGSFDVINLDIQGAELLALRGATKTLRHVRSIYCEVNTKELYAGGALVDEIDAYLKPLGFQRVQTKMTTHGWGDALYMRSLVALPSTLDCNLQTNGELKLLETYGHNLKTVIDVGANVGDWTCAALANSSAKLWAFEPDPNVVCLFAARFPQVNCSCLALGDQEKQAPLYRWSESGQNSGLNSLFKRPILNANLHRQPTETLVSVITLDKFCQEHKIDQIDMIKIDTEGSELNVLLGAQRLLAAHKINMIQFEYGGTYRDAGTRLKTVYLLLKRHGFTIHRIAPHGLIEVHFWSDRLEDYQYCNYCAMLQQS